MQRILWNLTEFDRMEIINVSGYTLEEKSGIAHKFLLPKQLKEHGIKPAQLKLKKLDLERQKTLLDANAGVSKNLQNAQAEVSILQAKTIGLSKQLNYLGISTRSLTPNSIK